MVAFAWPITVAAAHARNDGHDDHGVEPVREDEPGDGAPVASDDEASEAEAKSEAESAAKDDVPRAPKQRKRASKDEAEKGGLNPPAKMKGRVGFGALRTVAGLNGLVLRGYLGHRVTLGVNAGVATFSHRDVDEDGEYNRTRTVGRIGFGPELHFWPVQGDRDQPIHADFGLGLRMLAYFGFLGRLEEERDEGVLDVPIEIDVEIPAAMQLFIGRRVAIMPEFGVVFRIIPGRREPDQNGVADTNPGTGIGSRLGTTNGPGFGFEVGDHAGFFMGIGVGYYFGKT